MFETEKSWGCSGYKAGCKATIWKTDFFFQKVFGKKITKKQALSFLAGDEVIIKGAIVKGKKCDASLTWGLREGEKDKFGFDMTLDFPYGRDDKK